MLLDGLGPLLGNPVMELAIACSLFALATNLDNLTIGIAYGIRRITIHFSANLAIALLSGISTYLSMHLGGVASQVLPLPLAHYLGNAILIYLGTAALLSLWQQNNEHHQRDDSAALPTNGLIPLTIREAIALGLALTLTNVGTGIAAGLAGLNILGATLFSFFSSLLFIGGGVWLGHQLIDSTPAILRNKLEFFAACVLILLGLSGFVNP